MSTRPRTADGQRHLRRRRATPTGYGRYTSAANIGVYLWAVVAAYDLGLIGRPQAARRIQATLSEVRDAAGDPTGFLYQWYDTTTGHVIRNPGRHRLRHRDRRRPSTTATSSPTSTTAGTPRA